MMRRWRLYVGALFFAVSVRADDAVLTLPGEAKGAALGEAYSASANGAEALWYNPAGLSRLDIASMSLMHTAYLEGISLNTFGVAYPFGSRNAVGIGFSYLNAGSVPSYDNTGAPMSSYSPKDVSARVAIAKSFYGTSAGLSFFYLKSTIVKSAATFGLNAGLHQNLGPVSAALVGENFGGKLKYDTEEAKLPQRVKAGATVRLLPMFKFSTEVVAPSEGALWIAGGAETKVFASDAFTFLLRGGYNTRSSDVNGLSGISAGAGVTTKGVELNYAWVPFGDLGQTHRVSLGMQFGEQPFNPNSERDLGSRSLWRPKAKRSAHVQMQAGPVLVSAKMPVAPWKKWKTGWRTSKDKIITLLARDALCSDAGAQAVLTRTLGSVMLKPFKEEKKWTRIRAGRFVFTGDMVRTGVASYAHVVYANGVRMEIRANTRVTVEPTDDMCQIIKATLHEGEVYAVSEEGKELTVQTPLGEARIVDAGARVSYDGKTVLMSVHQGTGTFNSDGVTVPIQANTTFAKTDSGKTEKTSLAESDSRPTLITPPADRHIPGRWDPQFAKTFQREMMRLDSVAGLKISEYVRDTTLRNELKLKILDGIKKESGLREQLEEFRKDVDQFKALRESLKKPPPEETREMLHDRLGSLKQAKKAMENAQQSFKEIQKELQASLKSLRDDQEFLAKIPIVRMLNITAEESTIPFATGRSVVPEEAGSALDAIGDSMMHMKPYRVVVEGHTDKSGRSTMNERLSKQRAEAVALYLRKRTGFPARQFLIKGMGAAQPIDTGDTPEAMAKNRRVEIWFELRGL